MSQVVNRASQGLEAAKNIPRLYRRTNKEVSHYEAESDHSRAITAGRAVMYVVYKG